MTWKDCFYKPKLLLAANIYFNVASFAEIIIIAEAALKISYYYLNVYIR